jgi:hypothetical protein
VTWAIYTQITAKARALEMLIAVFVAFWAFQVLIYAMTGTGPLAWAGLIGRAELAVPLVLLTLGALHWLGTWLADHGPLPAVARAVSMVGMALVFAALSWAGGGTSAAPTYAGIALACLGAAIPAAKDARYARIFHATNT